MATREELEQIFRERGIDCSAPGFYDLPAFRRGEGENPRFIENYCEYVHLLQFDREYQDRTRAVILELSNFLAGELAADGRTGACIDVSGALMRMLEREGVWSCMVGGAAIVFFPQGSGLKPAYFWPFVHPENPAKTGHMWLFAPPFKVVDITLGIQNWNVQETKYISRVIAFENFGPAATEVRDLLEDKLVEKFYRDNNRMPRMEDISSDELSTTRKFPAFEVMSDETRIKYVPTHVGVMDGSIEQMRNLRLCGLYPAELYERFLEQKAKRAADHPKG
jgi:hypothetical protein